MGAKRGLDQYDKDGKLIRSWCSCREAAKSLKISNQSITAAAKGKQKTSGGYIWKYTPDDIENEVWRKHPEYNVECSDQGRIKFNSGRITKGGVCKTNGYMYTTIKDDKIQKSRLIHRLIMETFDPFGELIALYSHDNLPHVDHIDACKTNNCLDNLQWLNPKEHGVKTSTQVNKLT